VVERYVVGDSKIMEHAEWPDLSSLGSSAWADHSCGSQHAPQVDGYKYYTSLLGKTTLRNIKLFLFFSVMPRFQLANGACKKL
jgi:hypothetical protein